VRTIELLGGIVGCCAAAISVCQAQESPLRWKFEAGKKFEIQVAQKTNLETEVDLAKQTLETATQLLSHWEVVEVDDSGTAKINMVIRSIKLDVIMPVADGVRTLNVDTSAGLADDADDWEKDAHANLSAVIGHTIALTVDARGGISEVALGAETKDALRQAPQSMQIRQLLSDEGLRELFASAMPLLPEKDVQANEPWMVSQEFAGPAGKFRREQTMTWSGQETHQNLPQEKIGVTANLALIEPTRNTQATGEPAVPMPEITSQSTTGTLWFDAARGMLTNGWIESKLTTVSPYRDKRIEVQVQSRVDLNVRPIQ
jgi:hypothetical protein